MPKSYPAGGQTTDGETGLVDQHVHPENGPYAPGTYPRSWFESYLEVGRTRSVMAIGVVEHAYRFREAKGLLDVPWADRRCLHDLAQYDRHRRELREAGLPFRFGLEVDHVPGQTEAIRRFLELRDWDLVLGSVHWLADFPIDLDPERWRGHHPDDVWESYTQAVEDLCASHLYDVLTHPDLPKLFGHRPTRDPVHWYRRISEALARADMAMEINTKGLRRPVRALYPAAEFLAEAFAQKVPISFGSDAHEPERVGEAFDMAVRLARDVGYTHFVSLESRKRTLLPLPDLGVL